MNAIYSIAFTAALAFAQDDVVIFNKQAPLPPARGQSFTFFTNRSESAVKGSPYSGDTITETVQTLADGNRISRTNKSSFARDSEGRTRRETTIEGLGPVGKTETPMVSVFIDDPVAKVSYTLDPKSKTAYKSSGGADIVAIKSAAAAAGKPMGIMTDVIIDRKIPAGAEVTAVFAAQDKLKAEALHAQSFKVTPDNYNVKREELGTKNMEGVTAKGSRLVMTIAPGEVGNEKAIEVVTETWFSDELKASVYVRHSDPRMGETTTRLSNIHLGEPSKSLFEPPAEYRIEEGGKFRTPMPAIRVREDR